MHNYVDTHILLYSLTDKYVDDAGTAGRKGRNWQQKMHRGCGAYMRIYGYGLLSLEEFAKGVPQQ